LSLSRTGPPREGYEYQDLQGVLVLLDWLAHPSIFTWVKFEAREYGSLDDFAVCYSNRTLRLNQVKHTGETPDRPEFGIDDLTEAPPRGGRSLFEKWYRSWSNAERRGVFRSITPILKTNKSASRDLLALTKTTSEGVGIDVRLLKSMRPELYLEFTALARKSDSRSIDGFFRALKFEFGLPDIPVLREMAEKKCRELSLEPSTCSKLEDEVWNWAKRGTELTLADVKSACGWFVPRGVVQRFPMPVDYVPLGGKILDEMARFLAASSDGVVRILNGAPGSGKSTFLEDLYGKVSARRVSCIRHHYYVPGAERYDRLKFEDAAGALIHELQRKLYDKIPSINPAPHELAAILDGVASRLHANGHALVVIIDGLDHVVRDEDEDALIDLLRVVLPKRSGLRLVLGTRDLPSSSRVASLLEEYLPREEWTPIPPFDWNGCAGLLNFHRAELGIDSDHHFEEVVSAFFKVTAGYPLHCRYVITRLIHLAATKVVLASDIEQLEPFGGDVPTFYSQTWKSVPDTARSVAALLALAQFEMTGAELSSALKSAELSNILGGVEALRPLLEDGVDGLRFFHSSFAEFVRSTEAFHTLAPRLLPDLISWLVSDAPNGKRWTWLLRKKAEAGDSEPLIAETTRSWIVESVRDGRDVDEIVSTLRLASATAMARNDYGRALQRGQHSLYLQNSLRFFERQWDRFEVLNRRRISGSVVRKDSRADILYRDSEFLVELARDADAMGARNIIDDIIDELNGRLFHRRKQSAPAGDSEHSFTRLVRVAALLRGPIARATRFIKRLNPEFRLAVACAFADELVASGQPIAFSEFVNSPQLLSSISCAAADAGALAAFDANFKIDGPVRREGAWLRVHRVLSHDKSILPIRMPDPKEIPQALADYDMKGQDALAVLYQTVFVRALLFELVGKARRARRWASNLQDGWANDATQLIVAFAIECGTSLRTGSKISSASILEFNRLRLLDFGQDRDIWGLKISLRKALIHILNVSLTILRDVTGLTVDQSWIEGLSRCQFLNEETATELMDGLPARVLHRDDTRAWISKQVDKWKMLVEEFPTRAETHLSLASLSLKIGDKEVGADLLGRTVENMLGYGNHKDMFLLEVVETIDACRDVVSPDRRRDWFRRVAPIANSVASFTDKDETGHLAVDFGRALARHDRFAGFREYIDLVNEERLYLAEDLFPKLIPHLDLGEQFESALARTCTDYDSRRSLEKLAASGSSAARVIADELTRAYGSLASQEDRASLPGEGESTIAVRDVPPSKLYDVASSVTYSSNRSKFVREWLNFWMPRSAKDAYSALKPWFDPGKRSMFDAGIVVQVYPFVRQFEGPEQAFSLLCEAHRAAYGWSRFFVDSDAIDQIFEVLARDYPGRWREFIHCTLKGGRAEMMSFLPAPVGTRFLVRFGATEEASSHCEAAVKTLEELMGGLQLPPVEWGVGQASVLDVVFARLFWISPVVRERTAFVLAELLETGNCSKTLFDKFVGLLREERLDSRVVVLLTPIVRAAKRGFRADIGRLRNAVRVQSLPVNVLLNMIEAAT